jgi:hypothetical protein
VNGRQWDKKNNTGEKEEDTESLWGFENYNERIAHNVVRISLSKQDL